MLPPKLDSKGLKKVQYNPFSSGPISTAIATTEAQREIWATLALDKDATLCYNESLSLEMQGDVNAEILNLAFQEILKRHDALRSVFSSDGKFFLIQEFMPRPLQFLNWSQNPNAQKELIELKQSQVTNKIDLVNGPCFFGTLLKLAPEKFVFIITGHHIICDGWSFAVLLTELSTIYSAFQKNVPFSFEAASQFSEYALNESHVGLNLTHKQYWAEQFRQPLKPNQFPLDFQRPKFRTYNSARIDVAVSELTVKNLKKLGASQGCSLYTVLMASFQILMSKITAENEFVIGMAAAAQSESGKNDLIGHLVNLLPLKASLDPNQQFKFYLKEVRSKMLDAFEHQLFSLGSLLKDLNLKRDPAEIPLLNVVFNIDQQAPDQGLNFDALKANYTVIPRNFENFELFINAVSCGNTLSFECQYNTNLFTASTIQNWFSIYVNLLDQLHELSDKTINSFHLLVPKTSQDFSNSSVSQPRELIINPELESQLKKIWGKVLDTKSIKASDNFFTLGGHSLLAVEVVSLILEELKRDVSIRDIFENPTLGELTSKLSELSHDQKIKKSEIQVLTNDRSIFPITNNQMQVWYLEEMYPGTVMHNLPSSIRLKFSVDRLVLEKTLHYLVQRHSALRTAIILENGVPVQKVLDKKNPQLAPVLELQKVQEKDLVNILNQEASKNFNKEVPPLFTAKLYQIAENDFVFFFMVHHSIWDGWCFDIFFEELNIVYSALIINEFPRFSKNPEVNYTDYSLWLKNSIETGELDSQLAFWKQKLHLPLPVLELPIDFKRPAAASHEGATFPFQLTEKLARDLRSYAGSQGSSVYNVLLTAFKITLSRYCNLEDIIVGSPVRARNNPQLLQVIGYFVNTVALRTQIDLSDTFEASLKRVSQTCLEAFDNEVIPFQVVLNAVDYTRDSGRTPVFQTFFSYQDVSNRQAVINGLPYTQINIDKASTHTDLDLWIKASDNKIEGAFEYRKDLFHEITISRLSECFLNLLGSLTSHINVPLIKRSLLPDSQLKIVLEKWNDTSVDTTHLTCFHHTFQLIAKKYPAHLAIENSTGSFTYQELDLHSNKVAQALIKEGIGRGDLVGVSLTRDLKMMIALLGIMKSGAGYVPLDPAFPQDRLDYMIESSKPRKLILETALLKRFSKFNNISLIDDLMNDVRVTNVAPQVSSDPNDTMYVIYTSGSTGNPKGVEVSHGALANFLVSMAKEPGLTESDKLLAVTTLSFDIATLEIFLPLTKGASLFLASSFDVMDGKALRDIILNHQINIMQATPSTWRLLIAAGWTGNSNFKALCGGEAFPIDLAQKLISMCSSVWNMYGPTETTVWSTCKKLSPSDVFVSIGRPIDNTLVYILDQGLNLVPIGAPGELYIGGSGLAKGYFKRPDLTIERFIDDPFHPGSKMYATGDFARFTSDGEIECLGRQDGQVKVRGYRIELGEIEAVLSKTPSIKENAVITKETRPGDVRIIAFLVLNGRDLFDERIFRENLAQRLPKYMVPSHFMVIQELPRTLNGKIDKKSLSSLFIDQKAQSPVESIATTFKSDDPVYDELRLMWIDLLGNPMLQPSDNFFNIGGNSLLAVQLFSKIAKKYRLNLPLSLLLEATDFQYFVNAVKIKLNSSKDSTPLNSKLPNAFSSIVSIKASGQRNPVFCFHGVGGNVLNYMALVPAFSANRPLVGLQSRGMDGLQPMTDSIEEMAKFYITEMRAVQPHGPYFLAGGSMGGTIALEVAQQLTLQGETIEKLVMFDTFGPNVNIQVYDKSERSFWQNLKISFFYRRKAFTNKLKVNLLSFFNQKIPLEIRLFNLEMNNYQALWKYRPQIYSGDLHIIRAKMKPSGWYSDPLMGWSETIIGKIHTYEIEGNHNDFIESPELCKVFAKLL